MPQREFLFKKIDAFASASSTGNPAGLIMLREGESIGEAEMQRIASELKGFVSEVGYASRVNPNTLRLRFFSALREVEFCGHAIIAILYDLLQSDSSMRAHARIRLITNKGETWVENRLASADAVFIWAPKPVFDSAQFELQSLAQALGCPESQLLAEPPIRLINAGLNTLLVPVASLDAMLALHPDQEGLRQYSLAKGLDIVTCFCPEVADPANQLRTRVFAPSFGYLEDPATGSGNSALGYYLRHYGLWSTESLRIEQNGERRAFNTVHLQAASDEAGEPRVLFGGSSKTRIVGSYRLDT